MASAIVGASGRGNPEGPKRNSIPPHRSTNRGLRSDACLSPRSYRWCAAIQVIGEAFRESPASHRGTFPRTCRRTSRKATGKPVTVEPGANIIRMPFPGNPRAFQPDQARGLRSFFFPSCRKTSDGTPSDPFSSLLDPRYSMVDVGPFRWCGRCTDVLASLVATRMTSSLATTDELDVSLARGTRPASYHRRDLVLQQVPRSRGPCRLRTLSLADQPSLSLLIGPLPTRSPVVA